MSIIIDSNEQVFITGIKPIMQYSVCHFFYNYKKTCQRYDHYKYKSWLDHNLGSKIEIL